MVPHRTIFFLILLSGCPRTAHGADSRPNILIAISDDQSWPHASAYGSKMVKTPAFDRIAREGILFTQAFCPSPGCSPSRAALLTGRNTWQLEHAGTHGSWFDPKYATYPERLAASGYWTGYTGKGWGPGDFTHLGRKKNPAGNHFKAQSLPAGGSYYAAAFETFLSQRSTGQPFCFWFGSSDAHRGYKLGSGLEHGKRLENAEVPPFLPDVAEIRADLLDYAFEVERFDRDFGKMVALLERAGELDNTLVIVTSDNGMPFPRAKANCYEYGIHMPLAIRWGKHGAAGRVVDDLVGFTDLTATIYEVAGVQPPKLYPVMGNSLVKILNSPRSGIVEPGRTAVFAARERHSSSRFNSLGYPQRAIRTRQYLYILNFKPERWPAGGPRKFAKVVYSSNNEILEGELAASTEGYYDIDASPTLTYLRKHHDDPTVKRYLDLAVRKRPAEELYDVIQDPGCLVNLAGRPRFATIQADLNKRLIYTLRNTGDPRIVGDGDVWETYPRMGKLRWFPKPDWARQHPDTVPTQAWLDARRPRS